MPSVCLHIGGLVAVGFDPTGRYLLTVSHSGRGVYDVSSWQRVARDASPAYPVGGMVEGIGPIAGQHLAAVEIDYDKGTLRVASPRGDYVLSYEEGAIMVHSTGM